jgi:hypothetical protein
VPAGPRRAPGRRASRPPTPLALVPSWHGRRRAQAQRPPVTQADSGVIYLKNGMHMHMDMRRPMDMNMDIAHMHTRTCTHAYVRVQLHERCTASPPPAISDRKGYGSKSTRSS